jgi:RNA recognition motif-containing protein
MIKGFFNLGATLMSPSTTRRGPTITLLPRKGVNMNIYVGNLSLEVTEEELRREFIAFGQVMSVNIMDDKYSYGGQSRGYGFVEMPSKSEGEAAIISLKGKSLNGRVIDVIAALPLSPKRDTRAFHSSGGRRFNRNGSQRRS